MTQMFDRNVLREQNAMALLAHGPRLTADYAVWIEARDRTQRKVLLGGLGCCGVGQMWRDEEARHAFYHGYADAPEMQSPE